MITDHPLAHLTATRFREFIREPEAVFWVFVFPVLLAAGLGFAFQSRPQQTIRVAVTQPASAVSRDLMRALATERSLIAESLDDSAARMALRTGRVALVIEPGRMAPSPTGTTTHDPKPAWPGCSLTRPCSAHSAERVHCLSPIRKFTSAVPAISISSFPDCWE